MNKIKIVKEKLEQKGYIVHYFDDSKDINKFVLSIIKKGTLAMSGGSVTLDNLKIREFLNQNGVPFLYSNIKIDESIDTYSIEEKCFISSVNALCLDGTMVSTDAYCNRIRKMLSMDRKIIYIIGKNKITNNISEAFERIFNYVTPKNIERLNNLGRNIKNSEEIIKASVVLHSPLSGVETHVILVNEEMGY